MKGLTDSLMKRAVADVSILHCRKLKHFDFWPILSDCIMHHSLIELFKVCMYMRLCYFTCIHWLPVFFILYFLFILQDMIKDFLEKREKGELAIQKASKLRENVLGKVRKLLLGYYRVFSLHPKSSHSNLHVKPYSTCIEGHFLRTYGCLVY